MEGHAEEKMVAGEIHVAIKPLAQCGKDGARNSKTDGAAWPIVEKAGFKLPRLRGSEKQVAWADKIRGSLVPYLAVAYEGMSLAISMGGMEGREAAGMYMLTHGPLGSSPVWKCRFCDYAMGEFRTLEEFRAAVEGADSAHWWIEHREDILEAVRDLASKRRFALVPDVPDVPEAAEAMAEALLLPEGSRKSDVPAEIYRSEGKIKIRRIAFDDDFRLLVRGLGYKWDEGRWNMELDALAGDPADRMAEAAAALVRAGFPVACHDPAARDRALAGDWSPRQTRWILAGDNDGFLICWERGDDDFYGEAKSLPGASWKGCGMAVPFDVAEAVADFASEHGFDFTPAARARLDAFREAFAKGRILPASKASGRKKPSKAKPGAPAPGGVDPELMDTDD